MAICGVDFGTTNSLVSYVAGDKAISLVNAEDQLPHPSVVGYSGSEIVVGRRAKARLDTPATGVFGEIVRSPKTFLGTGADIYVAGVARPARDVVAEIFKFLRDDARNRRRGGITLDRAVVTIPINMRGRARRELRDAALQADVHIFEFVHEPLAALYGYVRASTDYKRRLAELEGKLILVFDWGGGTLDLTLCQVSGGTLTQVANFGSSEVGGDRFDERVLRFVREEHMKRYGLSDLLMETPGAEASLLAEAERAKIDLSARDGTRIFVKDFLKTDGPARHLEILLRRNQLEDLCKEPVTKGMGMMEELLRRAQLHPNAIELCLATGGMIRMPIIRQRLLERFGISRVPIIEDGDRIIAEGAAWIAHDGILLRLAKPFEVLQADNAYLSLIHAGVHLPTEGNVLKEEFGMYSVDPRDGHAKFQFARPQFPGRNLPGDPRDIYETLTVKIDEGSRPFLERLELSLEIDENLIASVKVTSSLAEDVKSVEIHDLEFGLGVMSHETGEMDENSLTGLRMPKQAGVQMRSNVAMRPQRPPFERWDLVPGEIVSRYSPRHLDVEGRAATALQRLQHEYYLPCSFCGRTGYRIKKEGCLTPCVMDGPDVIVRRSAQSS